MDVTPADRAERIDEQVVTRLCGDLQLALRRRAARELRLAGVLRALAPHSATLRDALLSAFELLVKRASFERPLYVAAARTLGEAADGRSSAAFERALASEVPGSLATLSALCRSTDPALAEALAKVARSRHAHWAFAGEVARIARGESFGAHIASLAPKIKESHRIALCLELFVPLTWQPALSPSIAPALAVLREAERDLGRWLVLAELATRAGDAAPLAEAVARASSGNESARDAWKMVAWALSAETPPPAVRPTVELVARLSDRPSADRDSTFLFRLARRKAPSARAMLEGLAKAPLREADQVRAALHLLREYGDRRPLDLLRSALLDPRRTGVHGLAAAALFDSGERELALHAVPALLGSPHLSSLAWGALIQAAQQRNDGELLTEPNVRRIQFGWSE